MANIRAAASALANARRALSDIEVRAPHDGRIVGLHISTGEVVAPSQSLFTLINTEEWFASANFRETDLNRIRLGDCVTVYSMIDRRQPMKGIVDSVGYGILRRTRSTSPERLLTWNHHSTGSEWLSDFRCAFVCRTRLNIWCGWAPAPSWRLHMAPRANSSVKDSSLWHLVTKASPGRLAFAARLALICTLVAVFAEVYKTPEIALTSMSYFFSISRIARQACC